MEKIIVTLWIMFGDIPNSGWSWGDLVADGYLPEDEIE